METAIASNATLQGSFDQIERLAYRLLDWGDFRIYRLDGRRAHPGVPRRLRPARPRRAARRAGPAPAGGARQRRAGHRSATSGAIRGWAPVMNGRGQRRSSIPSGSATTLLGIVEVDHPKRHAYGAKDLVALSTLANQMATAIHIAELRRPLLSTVEPDRRAGDRAGAGDRVAARLRRRARPRCRTACGRARPTSSASSPAGCRSTDALSAASRAMAEQGAQAAAGERDRGRGGQPEPGGHRPRRSSG